MQVLNQEKKLVARGRPRLHKGINLVRKPEGLPVFQQLAAAELEGRDASAVWIDTRNESSTYALSSFSPGLLEKVFIGRAFTPFQHHALIQNLEESIRKDTELLIIPEATFLYLNGQIKRWEAEQLFQETWKKILDFQDKYGLKVLISLPDKDSDLGSAVKDASENTVEVKETSEGWRYSSGEFKQLAYNGNGDAQTTLSYWREKKSETVKVAPEQV